MALVSSGLRLPSVLLEDSAAKTSDDLSTEILPAPPTLSSLPPVNFKRDSHQKKAIALTQYLPTFDPGSTYTGGSGVMSGLEAESGRRKRPRLEKRCVPSVRIWMAAEQFNGSYIGRNELQLVLLREIILNLNLIRKMSRVCISLNTPIRMPWTKMVYINTMQTIMRVKTLESWRRIRRSHHYPVYSARRAKIKRMQLCSKEWMTMVHNCQGKSCHPTQMG